MTPRAVKSSPALEACTLQLQSWKPFQIQTLPVDTPKHYSFRKKPCRLDRSTAPPLAADGLDLSRLSLLEEPPPSKPLEEGVFRWLAAARKRRRRFSRSVSGRSSDRSGTRRPSGCGGSAAQSTCSDFPLGTCGTDSSGELFVNGDVSCGSDVSDAKVSRKDGREGGSGGLEKDGSAVGLCPGVLDSQGNESGYGSEPGYRGDAEFGYGDEFDEEDEDGKHLFWFGGLGVYRLVLMICKLVIGMLVPRNFDVTILSTKEEEKNSLFWFLFQQKPGEWRLLKRLSFQSRRLTTDAGGRRMIGECLLPEIEAHALPESCGIDSKTIPLSTVLLMYRPHLVGCR